MSFSKMPALSLCTLHFAQQSFPTSIWHLTTQILHVLSTHYHSVQLPDTKAENKNQMSKYKHVRAPEKNGFHIKDTPKINTSCKTSTCYKFHPLPSFPTLCHHKFKSGCFMTNGKMKGFKKCARTTERG